MERLLVPHPDTPCPAAQHIAATATRPAPGSLALHYRLEGRLGDLRLPPPTASARRDGLWRQTCFEAFLQATDRSAYCEVNLAPSTDWAAYRFSGYREGMTLAAEIAAPDIEVRATDDSFELRARLDLSQVPVLPDDADWRLGLSAVIEGRDGELSYWALAHPSGKPDFHRADCFVLALPAALQP